MNMLRETGDRVRIHVRWVREMRGVTEEDWGYSIFSAYNRRKFHLTFEALLDAEMHRQRNANARTSMVVVLDLDVVVLPGWSRALRSCLEGKRGAHVCFFEQPSHPFEIANCGVVVLRGGS